MSTNNPTPTPTPNPTPAPTPTPVPGSGGTQDPGQAAAPLTYDNWVSEQPEEVTKMLEQHTSGLKSALDSEREGRKKLEGNLRTLAETAEGERKQAIETIANDLGSAEQKSSFYEDAHGQGITNLRLGYAIAVQDNLFNRKGEADFEKMRLLYPELFNIQAPGTRGAGGAGAGTGDPQPQPVDFNAALRKAAGR